MEKLNMDETLTVFKALIHHLVEQICRRFQEGSKQFTSSDQKHILELLELTNQIILVHNH